ncbi:MAG: hypothetical protein CM1200mP39_26550 [Dehalococcoidia bacterium]|nr:MAG: hypothetical protein CM1200mP39_26550 [Dehalococcoidia bacterium]
MAGASRSKIKIVEKKSKPNRKDELEIFNYFSNMGIDAEIVRVDGNFTREIHKLQADDPGSWILIGSKMRQVLAIYSRKRRRQGCKRRNRTYSGSY